MTTPWRILVAVFLLAFAWNGSSLNMEWPPRGGIVIPKPEPVLMKWAEPLRPLLPKMMVADRQYLSAFYDALSFVLLRDSKRANPVVKTTADFVGFHAGSLQLAIDKENVGKYPGLGGAIDEVIVNAIGAEQRALTADDRTKLIAGCSVLSYAFRVGSDE